MSIITSVFGSNIGKFYSYPYWAVKLRDGKWLSSVDRYSLTRNYDWTLDLVTTSDVLKIEQLWMFCPKNELSKEGNTAVIHFLPEEAGTAFHFNVTHKMVNSRKDHMLIGKVTDRGTGDCYAFIWDDVWKVMSTPFYTNVHDFKPWRAGIGPIGQLSLETIGLVNIPKK